MKKLKVGITHGDINGVNYEILLNTLSDSRILEICTPVVYGSAKVAAYYRKALNINSVPFTQIRNIDEAQSRKANLINCADENVKVEIGESTPLAGAAAFDALECAMADIKAGKLDILVTAPINKSNIQSDKFNFKGHTDYLQERLKSPEVVMFMVSDFLRVGLVCEHVQLSKVPSLITKEKIVSKLKAIQKSLIEDFSVTNPIIAVLGLNPHAGDSGLLGNEEADIIVPAIKIAREHNIMAMGPFAADGFFGSGDFRKFDAVLAMYHDQGLIPFKALTAGSGVNFTAGLPIVRTSPAHGTAFDIAGKGEASTESFRNALYAACDIATNRQAYIEVAANKLKPVAANMNLGPADE